MWFYIAMFLCNLLMPLIMLIGGYCMDHFPPRKINSVIGYRTKMSKKNKDTWDFAHHYCGKLWLKWGLIVLFPTIAVQIPFAHSGDQVIGTVTFLVEAVQLTVLLCSIVPVEKALKRTFDENGVRR